MNAERRKKIQAVVDTLTTLRDEEQEAFDNMPEGLQGSEKGDIAQSAIQQLDEAINALEGLGLE